MTQKVALIGQPLRRRHSAVMHNAGFEAFGIDAYFDLIELAAEDLGSFVAAARNGPWLGFGVTAPYKRQVMEFLDEVEPDAQAIGAMNNAVRDEDRRLLGFNTDAPGFALAVRGDLGVSLDGSKVVVAGAGGAAHAVVHACLSGGASDVMVINRTLEGGQRLAERFADLGGTTRAAQPGDDAANEALAGADLLVNATTVGMVDGGVALPPEELPTSAAVFDLVYVPEQTELLRRAQARGLRSCNGASMLIAQGALAFERWTGVPAEDVTPVMATSIEPLLANGGRG